MITMCRQERTVVTHCTNGGNRKINFLQNEKVLLRERKRHTARRVASARYSDLFPDRREGAPHPVLDMDGGVLHPLLVSRMRYPHPELGWGILPSPGWGTFSPLLDAGSKNTSLLRLELIPASLERRGGEAGEVVGEASCAYLRLPPLGIELKTPTIHGLQDRCQTYVK